MPALAGPRRARTSRTHSVILAARRHGCRGAGAPPAARPGHFARVRPMADDGTLLFGGAILDAPERMVGSVAVTRHVTHEAARNLLAADPYATGEVWQDITVYGTTLRPLPYRPLPRP